MKLSIRHFIIIIALGCSALLLLGCSGENRSSLDQSSLAKVDSINNFILNGRKLRAAKSDREYHLNRAQTLLPSVENDSLKSKLFSKLSLAYLKLNDSVNFRKTNKKTLRLSSKINDATTLAETNWDLADFYRMYAVADSSYYHYSKAKDIYEKLNKTADAGAMLINMAIVQAEIKDYTGSEITTIQAIKIFESLENNEQLYKSYNILGTVSKDLKEYGRSLDYYRIALEYQKKIATENDYGLHLNNNIGVVFQKQGDFKVSVRYFDQTFKTKDLFKKDAKLFAIVLNNLLYSQSKIYQNRDLSTQFEKAIRIQDSIGDIAGISRSHYSFADYYLGKEDTINALKQAKEAKYQAERAKNNNRILQTLQLLTKVDPKNASAYNQRYITLNDSLQQEERQVRNKFARIRFETDEYIAENQVLASEKQLWSGISLAIFLLGASALVIINQRSKNQKLRLQQEQQAANLEIFNLMLSQNRKEEEGKKSEQKRISEELHDGVLGKMMGARMVLTGLNRKSDHEAETQRKKAIDALQDVEKEVREISHNLSYTAYQKVNNFILSVQQLLDSVAQTAHIDCTLDYDTDWEWDSLNGEIKINMYRLIQECLQNSVKHAQCSNFAVTFKVLKTGIQMLIADDGQGFRVTKGKRGIGMRNIASRIEKLNGKWKIDSKIGEGTMIRFDIPASCSESKNVNTM